MHRCRPFACLAVALLLVSSAGLAGDPASEDPGTASLQVVVAIVDENLAVHPVPKQRFTIRCSEAGLEKTVSTSFEGRIEMELPRGACEIESRDEIRFGRMAYRWKVPFSVDGDTTLELSNDNATVRPLEEVPPRRSPVVLDEALLYRKYRDAIFKVISESGHGSGFLVHRDGLIATNSHVVHGSDYLAIKTTRGYKYPAVLVVEDEDRDIAILRVNPAVIAGLEPLPLARDTVDMPSVAVGDRIVALGSPLSTEAMITSGIVGKVEQGVIKSDVNLNPGSSGGPVLNAIGDVVGMATFGNSAGHGPGVSGAIRAYLVASVLQRALDADVDPPPADRLPVASRFPYPVDALKKIVQVRDFRPRDYHIEAGPLDIQVITPVTLALLEERAAKIAAKNQRRRRRRAKIKSETYVPGQDFYAWRRYVGDYRPVVVIQAIPEIRLTGGSAFAVFMLGPGVPKQYRFKADFVRMELERDGTVVQPIHPGRISQVVNTGNGVDTLVDVQVYGAYEYPPEAFRPGAKVRLFLWDTRRRRPRIRDFPPGLLVRIWEDFRPYREALERSLAGGEEGVRK